MLGPARACTRNRSEKKPPRCVAKPSSPAIQPLGRRRTPTRGLGRSGRPRVARLIAQFTGRELGQAVRLSVYDSYLEIAMESGPEGVAVRVPMEELGRVAVEEVVGIPMLIIEDVEGILVAGLRMEAPDARQAESLIGQLRES